MSLRSGVLGRPRSSIRAERTLVGEVWLPSQLEINIRGNFAFSKSAHFLNTMKYADYKKFTVEATVRPPQP